MQRAVIVIAVLAACAVQPVAAQRIRLSASLADLEKAARKDSNDAAAHYNVALAYWNAKRWDDADSALRRAVRLEPRFAAAYMGLAALPYARRPQLFDEQFENRVPSEWKPKIEESEQMYRQAVLIDPLVEVRIGYVMLPPSTSNFQTSLAVMFGDWFDDYLEGRHLYFEGKYQDSYVRFQRVYNELDGERHANRLFNTLLFWHGLAAAQVGKYDDASWDFGTILTRLENTEEAAKDSTLHLPLRTNEFRLSLIHI